MSFVNEKTVAHVRKRHLCGSCDKWIEIGEPAVNWAGMTDGDFGSAYFHPECREAEIAYNHDYLGNNFADEWSGLQDAESDDFPWIKEKWPLVYLRMRMTREQYASRLAEQVPA